MIYLVFGGDDTAKKHCSSGHACKVPRLMECGLDPPRPAGTFRRAHQPPVIPRGRLAGRAFLGTLTGGKEAEASHSLELGMQAIAGVIALAGLAIAHYRYGGSRRQERIAAARPDIGLGSSFSSTAGASMTSTASFSSAPTRRSPASSGSRWMKGLSTTPSTGWPLCSASRAKGSAVGPAAGSRSTSSAFAAGAAVYDGLSGMVS